MGGGFTFEYIQGVFIAAFCSLDPEIESLSEGLVASYSEELYWLWVVNFFAFKEQVWVAFAMWITLFEVKN